MSIIFKDLTGKVSNLSKVVRNKKIITKYVNKSLRYTLKSPNNNTLAQSLTETPSVCPMNQYQKLNTKKRMVVKRRVETTGH